MQSRQPIGSSQNHEHQSTAAPCPNLQPQILIQRPSGNRDQKDKTETEISLLRRRTAAIQGRSWFVVARTPLCWLDISLSPPGIRKDEKQHPLHEQQPHLTSSCCLPAKTHWGPLDPQLIPASSSPNPFLPQEANSSQAKAHVSLLSLHVSGLLRSWGTAFWHPTFAKVRLNWTLSGSRT